MYNHILVPLDGSPTSIEALNHAIALAKSQNANLILFNVIEDYSDQVGETYFDFDQFQAELKNQSQSTLEEGQKLAKAAGLNPQLRSAVLKPYKDRIADRILEEAKASDADLIVIGSHGRHGIQRLLIGSVAEGVIRSAHLPVLIIHAQDQE